MGKVNEQIKKLGDIISNDNTLISEIANLVAFFHSLSSFMSLSLIKTKKRLGITSRLPEILLWIDMPTILPQTQNLINVINQYLLILNSWSYETANYEFLKSLQNIHLKFKKFLHLYYNNRLNKFVFDKFGSLKIVESEDKPINQQLQRFSSIFHISNLNSILFLPTISSMDELAKQFKLYKITNNDSANYKETLKEIKNDLVNTYKELLFLLSDEKNCNIFNQDFLCNPCIDIIRENPQYQQYAIKISTMLPLILTEFSDLNSSINNLFSKLKIVNKLLKNSFALPLINFDELHRITTEETKYNIEKQKIKFIKKVFKKFSKECPEFQFQTATLINKIYKKYSLLSQTKDIDSIDSQLKDLHLYLKNSDYEKVFIEQENELISTKKLMDERLRKLHNSQPPKPPHDIELKIEDLRKSILKLTNAYNSERTEMNNEMLQSIERHITLFSQIQYKPIFPIEIEQMLQTLSHQAANFQWMNNRLEMQKEENKIHKEKIQNLSDNLAKLKLEIQEKKKLIHNLKANNSSQKVPKKNASCLCSSCHSKQVEFAIGGCGHTFCEICLKNCKCCPKCNHLITANDVCKINWI